MGLGTLSKRVKLTLEELKKSKPLPHALDPEWKPDTETFLWIMEHVKEWKPKRIDGLHGKPIEPIKYNGYEYHAVAYDSTGNIYLLDPDAYAILYEANGTKTAEDIVLMLIQEELEEIKKNDPHNPLIKAFEGKGDQDYVDGMFYSYYRHLAMLKKEGLII